MPLLKSKEVPLEVKKYILKVQGEIKHQKGLGKYSLHATIVQIIREHKEFFTLREKKQTN